MRTIERIKEYLKENKSKKFFYTGLKEKTIEQKYQYLKKHFTYDIMNSWNGLKSIANNVKVWNLGLTSEQVNKFFELQEIDSDFIYEELSYYIDDFKDVTKTDVFFNGRSGGYLVVIPSYEEIKRNQNILEWLGVDDIEYCESYKEFKEEKNQYTGGYTYSYTDYIKEAYYYVKAFDKLCDMLRSELIYILDNYKIEEHEEIYTKTVKEIIL